MNLSSFQMPTAFAGLLFISASMVSAGQAADSGMDYPVDGYNRFENGIEWDSFDSGLDSADRLKRERIFRRCLLSLDTRDVHSSQTARDRHQKYLEDVALPLLKKLRAVPPQDLSNLETALVHSLIFRIEQKWSNHFSRARPGKDSPISPWPIKDMPGVGNSGSSASEAPPEVRDWLLRNSGSLDLNQQILRQFRLNSPNDVGIRQ